MQQGRQVDGDEPVLAGVAAAVARRLDVETLAVRAAFVVLTVAGGWGVVLYAAGWLGLVWRTEPPIRPEPSAALAPARRLGLLLAAVGALLILRARVAGFHDQLVWPTMIVAVAGVIGWRQFGFDTEPDVPEARPHLVRVLAGLVLVIGGFAYLGAADLPVRLLRDGFVAVGVVAAGVLLVFAPWVVQLTRSLAEERRERIRADERAEVATHLHDSVLQTLTLLQKRSDDPQLMAALARHQERELRRWLYSAPDPHDGRGFREAVEAMVAEVEDQHLVHVDNVTVGDGPVEARLQTILSAAREALVNAAKFSGERTVSLYAELRPSHVELFVRDRGAGFRFEDIAEDRKGHQRLDPRPARPPRRHRPGPDLPRRRHRGPHAPGPAGMTRPRVVVVDDHRLFRAGVISELGDTVEVVGEAHDVPSAVEVIEATRPDVVVLDVHLPGTSGRAVIDALRDRGLPTRFLGLSVSDAPEDVIDLVRAGARGYVTKHISGEELAEAIGRVADGDAVFSPHLAGFVLDAFSATASHPVTSELDQLTPREQEVMQHLARGYAYKEIASELAISLKTVESHASAVLRKLQLSSRHQLTRWAAQHKLL